MKDGNKYSNKNDCTHSAFISIGSNMGDLFENIMKGIRGLSKTDGILLKKLSKFYQTEPVDYKDQAWFINAAAEIRTCLAPTELFQELKRIEKEVGRKESGIPFGPRILDLDIIFYDDLVLKTSQLMIPHPRMHHRRFVLGPLCDIRPQLVHPIYRRTMQNLLEGLTDDEQRIMEYS